MNPESHGYILKIQFRTTRLLYCYLLSIIMSQAPHLYVPEHQPLTVAADMTPHIAAQGLAQCRARPLCRPLTEGMVQLAEDAGALVASQILAGDIAQGHVARVMVFGDPGQPASGRLQHVLVLDALLDAELLAVVGALGVIERMPPEMGEWFVKWPGEVEIVECRRGWSCGRSRVWV